jgi:hypothetical protein
MSEVRSEGEIKRIIEDRIRSERFANISSIDNIVYGSLDIDTWGNIPIYKVDGYMECRVKTGILSTKRGKKGFSAKVDARNGKILAFNWQPGEPL